MNQCIICKTDLKSKRAKTCKEKKCISSWKMQRNQNLPQKGKKCGICGSEFQTQDSRNNYCGPVCKYKASEKVMLDKYGYANPNQKERTPEEKQILSEKHSVASKKAWADGSLIEKRNNTNLKKYGAVNQLNTPESIEKRNNTIKNKYLTDSSRIAGILKNCGLNYDEFSAKIIEFIETNKAGPYSDTTKKYLKSEFGVSNEVIDDVLDHTNRVDLVRKFKSHAEVELYEFLLSLGVSEDVIQVNKRPKFMKGLELDLFLPGHKFAIEYHGLAVHSEREVYGNPINKKAHYQKHELCKNAGIKLFQIFEDEWNYKAEIIKSMIQARLGLVERVYARKTIVREIPRKDIKDFFNETHVSGNVNNSVAYGLYLDDVLISAISGRSTWNKAYGKVLEIARYSTKKGYQVIGGFSKLLKVFEAWGREHEFEKILTYADLRFGHGEVYFKTGFDFLKHTSPNYFYERDGIRENRFKHRKDKDLVGATEREQQNGLGWYAIYDAGSNIFTKKL